MNRDCSLRWIVAFLLVLCIAVSVCAADTAPAAKPDARLDKKVTIEMGHAKLEDVVRQLTEQTGVTIKAGTGERDWKVRERRVTIQAKDVRLGTLMDEVSDLLGFYLSKSGKEGEWTYTFWQDMKGRMLESEMLNAEKEAAAQRSASIRQNALDTAAEALKLSPEEARKKKDTDPWLAYLGGTKSGRGYASLLGYLANAFPTERDLMLRGLQVSIPLTNLPPDVQQAAKDASGGGFLAFAREHMNNGGEDPFADIEPYQITMMPSLGFGEDQEMGMMGFGGMLMLMGKMPNLPTGMQIPGMTDGAFPMGMFPVAGSGSAIGELFGTMFVALEEGANEEAMEKLMGQDEEQMKFITEALACVSKTEDDPPTDPELVREIELDKLPDLKGLVDGADPKPEEIRNVVEVISKALGKPILVESFTGSMPMHVYMQPGKQPLYRILIGLEKAGYTWVLEDGMLRVRPDDWAIRRSYEIAEGLIAKYKDIIKKKGSLDLDALIMIAAELTDAQIDNTLIHDPSMAIHLSPLEGMIGNSRTLLRFYGSASPQQKSAMTSEAGMPFSALSSQQWDRLSTVITGHLGGVYVVDGSIKFEQSSSEKQLPMVGASYKFRITVAAGGEQEPRSFEEYITIYSKETIADMQKSVDDALKEVEKKSGETDEPAKESGK